MYLFAKFACLLMIDQLHQKPSVSFIVTFVNLICYVIPFKVICKIKTRVGAGAKILKHLISFEIHIQDTGAAWEAVISGNWL